MRAKMGLRDLPLMYQKAIGAPHASKYKNVATEYGGVKYHSAKEASYARDLDLLVRAGKLKSWERQVAFPLVVNGVKVATYVIDFVEEDFQGRKTHVEVKGMWTEVAKLKRKLFEALYPELTYMVV